MWKYCYKDNNNIELYSIIHFKTKEISFPALTLPRLLLVGQSTKVKKTSVIKRCEALLNSLKLYAAFTLKINPEQSANKLNSWTANKLSEYMSLKNKLSLSKLMTVMIHLLHIIYPKLMQS